MRTRSSLTSSDAYRMMAACKAEAETHHWDVSIAIVDDGGYLLLFDRMDGAGPMTPAVATAKARTAALSRIPTKALEDRVAERPSFLKLPEYLPVQGGMPIKVDGDCIGAIGVSGVQSHEDEQIANAGIAALG